MFIRSSKESLKSRNLSFLAKDRMDNLLKAQALSERAVAVIGNSESSLCSSRVSSRWRLARRLGHRRRRVEGAGFALGEGDL